MTLRALKFSLLASVLWACQPMPNPDPPPQPKKATCATACDNAGRKLRCDGWLDDDAGETCEQRCAAVQEGGDVTLDLDCVSWTAESCEAVDGC